MTAAPTTFTSGSTPFLSGSPYTPEPGTSEQKKFRPEPTEADLEAMAKKLGMPLEEEHRHIYMNAIKGIHQAAEFTLSQPDYIPHTHIPTYPRTNIHFPATQEELELGWAYKATVRKEPPVEFVDEDDVDSHEEQAMLNMTHTPGDAFSDKDRHTAGEQAREGGVKQEASAQPEVQGNAKPLTTDSSGTQPRSPPRKTKKITRRAPLIKDKRVTIKDMVMLKDVPCLFGAEVQDEGEFVSDMDATCVTRILDEGGVILGKANCEMSTAAVVLCWMSISGLLTSSSLYSYISLFSPEWNDDPNPHSWSRHWISCSAPRSIIQNPHAKGFSAGGSSSGCAALVCSDQVDLAIGGDQSGSIRIPASACGIVGLRPTFGLVPSTGVISHEAEKEVIGPMTRTVEDCAVLLETIAGPDWIDLRVADRPMPNPLPKYTKLLKEAREKAQREHPDLPLKGVRIGVLKEGFTVPKGDERVYEVAKDAVEGFRKLGAEIKEISCPSHVQLSGPNSVATLLSGTAPFVGRSVGSKHLRLGSFWSQILPWTPEKWEKLEPMLKLEIISAEYVAHNFPTAFDIASNLIRKLSADVDAMFEEVDLVVMPTCVKPPPRHVPKEQGIEGIMDAGSAMSANTNPYSASGHPALSLPVGFSPPSDGDVWTEEDRHIRLPVGLQLVAAKFNEMEIFIAGDAWERAYGKGNKDKFGLDRVGKPQGKQEKQEEDK